MSGSIDGIMKSAKVPPSLYLGSYILTCFLLSLSNSCAHVPIDTRSTWPLTFSALPPLDCLCVPVVCVPGTRTGGTALWDSGHLEVEVVVDSGHPLQFPKLPAQRTRCRPSHGSQGSMPLQKRSRMRGSGRRPEAS